MTATANTKRLRTKPFRVTSRKARGHKNDNWNKQRKRETEQIATTVVTSNLNNTPTSTEDGGPNRQRHRQPPTTVTTHTHTHTKHMKSVRRWCGEQLSTYHHHISTTRTTRTTPTPHAGEDYGSKARQR